MKKLTLLSAAALIGATALSSHSQEHEGRDSGQTEQREYYSQGGERSESDSHFSNNRWPDPPVEYEDKASNIWTDADAIAHGKKIWGKYCLSCHGADGQGTGLIAESLSHLPADLSDNFHTAPGDGDAYLFWRVSEGGTIEPFKSLGSSMPAFKNVLSESERWDVLAYVHVFFHQGLINWTLPEKSEDNARTEADVD
jgi:mono/diheme cytochrome c family protein